VVGLPLELWNDENFSMIAARFGTVAGPVEASYPKLNVSHMKMCIVTMSFMKINEEVLTVADGRHKG